MTPVTIGLTLAAIAVACLLVMWRLAATAPLGWEDSEGFHLSEPDEHANPDNGGI